MSEPVSLLLPSLHLNHVRLSINKLQARFSSRSQSQCQSRLINPAFFRVFQSRRSHLISPYQSSSSTSIPRVISSRKGHCNDTECFIRSPLSENDKWSAFDAFDPRDLDDYGYGLHRASTSTSDSRKMKRISEIRARAKERLMPPYAHSQRATTTTTRRGPRPSSSGSNASTASSNSTLLAPPPRERILRTPSPVGWDRENDAMERTPCAPQTPKTPIRSRRHLDLPRIPLSATQTPASTVGSPSPLGTPPPVLFFHGSSPCAQDI